MSAAMQGELELSTVDGCSDAAPGRHLDGDGLCQCRSACCLGQGTSLTVCLCTRGCECDEHYPPEEDAALLAEADARRARTRAYNAALPPTTLDAMLRALTRRTA